ncbi:MAG TPA: hypothetical protein VGJ20_30850 [Xanthobacteraceae bacterium]|jgi:hypothetical protein
MLSHQPTLLTHFASGFIFGRLGTIQTEYIAARGHNARLSPRAAAEVLIQRKNRQARPGEGAGNHGRSAGY